MQQTSVRRASEIYVQTYFTLNIGAGAILSKKRHVAFAWHTFSSSVTSQEPSRRISILSPVIQVEHNGSCQILIWLLNLENMVSEPPTPGWKTKRLGIKKRRGKREKEKRKSKEAKGKWPRKKRLPKRIGHLATQKRSRLQLHSRNVLIVSKPAGFLPGIRLRPRALKYMTVYPTARR